jgi:hypothetical protein
MKHKATKSSIKRHTNFSSMVGLVSAALFAGQLSFAHTSAQAIETPMPPNLSATIADGATTSSRSIEFTYSGDGGALFQCVFINGEDQRTIVCPPSPFSPDQNGAYPLNEGSYTFKVRQNIGGQLIQVDGKDVISGGSFSNYIQTSWTVDLTAPSAPTLSSILQSSSINSTAEFTFTGEVFTGVTDQGFQCQLDSGSWENCVSPKSYSGLQESAHVFKVRQVDRAGNVGAETSKSWTINLSARPAPTLISAPTSGSSTSATIEFSGSGSNFECKLNDQDYETNCLSPKIYSGLGDGNYTVLVRERDADGNFSNYVETTWTVDTSAPSVLEQRVPRTPNNSLSLIFRVKFNEPVNGLSKSDFAVNSSSCSVSGVTLNSGFYDVYLTNCGDKEIVSLSLLANSVSDSSGNLGPNVTTIFPSVFTDTSWVESVFQAPIIERIDNSVLISETKRSVRQIELDLLAERFPLATKNQILKIALFQSLNFVRPQNIATSTKLEDSIDFSIEMFTSNADRFFVPMISVPIESDGELEYIVFFSKTPLINPIYLL